MSVIRIVVDVDPSETEMKVIWWGYAPDFPGLTVVADSLRELETSARAIIEDLFRERGEDIPTIVFSLNVDQPTTSTAQPATTFDPAPDSASTESPTGFAPGEVAEERVTSRPVPVPA